MKKNSGVKNFLMVGVHQETNGKAALNSFRVKQGELKFEGEEEVWGGGRGVNTSKRNGSQILETLGILDILLTKLLGFFRVW